MNFIYNSEEEIIQSFLISTSEDVWFLFLYIEDSTIDYPIIIFSDMNICLKLNCSCIRAVQYFDVLDTVRIYQQIRRLLWLIRKRSYLSLRCGRF